MVTTTADSGTGSLRDALRQVNADTGHTLYASPGNPGVDEIDFNITAASDAAGGGTGFNATTGVATITPRSDLPLLTNPVIINGYTQTGASPNNLAIGDNAVLKIVLDGSQAGGVGTGVGLDIGTGGSTVQGLVIQNFWVGIRIDGFNSIPVSGNCVQGNYIGTNADGTALPSQGAGQYFGVVLYGNVANCTIGGATASARNVISGWARMAVFMLPPPPEHPVPLPTGNVVEGNYIGTNADGSAALVLNEIGSGIATAGSNNKISGNLISGVATAIALGDSGSQVQGNLIGTDASATQPILNGWGVTVSSSNVLIGGTTPGASNTIANNQAAGITVGGTEVRIEGNSIYGNGALGIDLNGSGVPILNDSLGHVGANNYQNFPALNSASSSSTSTLITGTFTEAAEPNTTITLDFYANPTGSSTTYGQGQTYLGSQTMVTDVSGNASFHAALALPTAGQWISATATDEANPTLMTVGGNTSEFSLDIQATNAPSQTFAQSLTMPGALPQSSTGPNTLTIQANTATISDVVNALSPSNLGSSLVPVSVYLNLAPGTYTPTTVQIPTGMTLYINGTQGTTIDPATSAFTLASGNVVVSNVTFITTGDAPTILVTGGHLTLRNDTIEESPGGNDAAIRITGGTVDLGTAGDPGNNTIVINGPGVAVQNSTSNAVVAVGDTILQIITDLSRAKQAGSTIPIRLELLDASGQEISAPGATLSALDITSGSGSFAAVAAGNANPNDVFQFVGGTQPYYQFNLQTKDLAGPGTYTLYFTVLGDPIVDALQFVLK
jgi:hypothetical protein